MDVFCEIIIISVMNRFITIRKASFLKTFDIEKLELFPSLEIVMDFFKIMTLITVLEPWKL